LLPVLTQLFEGVKFSQVDLDRLRPGDLLNLRDDLRNFLLPTVGEKVESPVLTPLEQPLVTEYTQKDFKTLQREVYEYLDELDKTEPTSSHDIRFRLSSFKTEKWPAVSFATGPVRDLVLLRLYLLLDLESDRIGRCQAHDCNRIFYRKHKPKYCSSRCNGRHFMQMKRAEPENVKNESEQNHRRYKARVEKSRGKPTRVQRRPPRRKPEQVKVS